MPTAFDFVKKNVRSAANAIPSMIDQGRMDLANQQVAANNAAMQTPIQAPEVKAPSNPAQDALNNEMLGRLMRPGRGRRKGQMVTSGGKYSGRTVDEIYGKLQKGGSGAGGGLRTGSLSEGSGIDWLKANRTSGKALARQEANVGATGDRFKAALKPVARPAMTQAPTVVDTKPMNMANAVPVSPQPVVTSPVAKAMSTPAVAAPQIPALAQKAPMRPVLPNMPNQFQPSQMSMASARPAATVAPMTAVTQPKIAPQLQSALNNFQSGKVTPAAPQPKIAPQLQSALNNFQTKPIGSPVSQVAQTPKIAPQLQSALNNFQTKPVGPPMTQPPAAVAASRPVLSNMPNQFQPPQMSPKPKISTDTMGSLNETLQRSRVAMAPSNGLPSSDGGADSSLFPKKKRSYLNGR